MDCESSESGVLLSTPQSKLLPPTSVDTEGGVALFSLTGEISDQLTIADHQKQAATYRTSRTRSITKIWAWKCRHSNLETGMLVLPKASHHCHTMGNSNITGNTNKRGGFTTHWVIYVVRYAPRCLLTYTGQHHMHKGDREGVVPNPPANHCRKQKAAAEVGELQRQEIYWGRQTQEK